MKKTTQLPQTKPNVTALWLLIGMLVLSACSQDKKDQSTSISVSLPRATMALLTNPSSVGGDLTGITSVVISVYYNNNRDSAPIASGDILAAGGTLKFTVLPYSDLYITGEAFDNNDPPLMQFFGETTVTGLQPGGSVPVALSLANLAQKAVSGIITTAGSTGTIQPGTTVQVLRVIGTTENLIAQGAVLDANGAYSLGLPEDVNPGSDIIFRVLVDQGEGTAPMDARYTTLNVNINPVTNAASGLVSRLVNTAETDLSAVGINEILEMEHTLNLIALDLGPQSELTFQQYSDLLTANLESDLETAHIASSAVASGEICGTVMDSSESPVQGITIIVRDFNSELLRARTETAADGSYCVNVPLTGDTDPLTVPRTASPPVNGGFHRPVVHRCASMPGKSSWARVAAAPRRIFHCLTARA